MATFAQLEAGRAVLVLDTSGVGALAPQPQNPYPDDGFYGTLQRLNDDLLRLGELDELASQPSQGPSP